MIKDVDESRRINNNLRAAMSENVDKENITSKTKLDATIVSKHFWPPFKVRVG